MTTSSLPVYNDPYPTTTAVRVYVTQPIVLPKESGLGVEVVGTVFGALDWKSILNGVVPSYLPAVDCVITSSTASYTYRIIEGIPMFQGVGALYQERYAQHAEQANIFSSDSWAG